MSPELATLDDLSGGDIPLERLRILFDNDERFAQAMLAMLGTGEIRILDSNGEEPPHWAWREIVSSDAISSYRASITDKGAARIA